jgi:hypothetical protein
MFPTIYEYQLQKRILRSMILITIDRQTTEKFRLRSSEPGRATEEYRLALKNQGSDILGGEIE